MRLVPVEESQNKSLRLVPVGAPTDRQPALKEPEGSRMRGVLPRTAERGAGNPLNPVLDLLSLPGRAVGADIESGKTTQSPFEAPEFSRDRVSGSPWGTQTRRREGNLLESMADTQGQGFVQGTLRDPALIPSMAAGGGAAALLKGGLRPILQRIGASAAAGAGSAATHQAENVAAGEEIDPMNALSEIGLSAAVPVATGAAGVPLRAAHWGARHVAPFLSGVSRKAGVSNMEGARVLERYGLGRSADAKNLARMGADPSTEAATQGGRLRNAIETFTRDLPETKIVDEAIAKAPPVSLAPVLQSLEKSKRALSIEGKTLPASKLAEKRIDELMQSLRGNVPTNQFPKTKMSAKGYLDLRRSLDQGLPEKKAVDFNLVQKAVLNARTAMKNELEKNVGPQYAKAMKDWSTKIEFAENLGDVLSSSQNPIKREIAASKLINRVLSDTPDGEVLRREIRKLDAQKGTRIMRDLDDLYDAKILGDVLSPSSALPSTGPGQAATAAAVKGTSLGLAGRLGRMFGLPIISLTSPRGAATVLGSAAASRDAARTVAPAVREGGRAVVRDRHRSTDGADPLLKMLGME